MINDHLASEHGIIDYTSGESRFSPTLNERIQTFLKLILRNCNTNDVTIFMIYDVIMILDVMIQDRIMTSYSNRCLGFEIISQSKAFFPKLSNESLDLMNYTAVLLFLTCKIVVQVPKSRFQKPVIKKYFTSCTRKKGVFAREKGFSDRGSQP